MLSNAFQSFRARLIRVQPARRPRYQSHRHARAAQLVQLASRCYVSTESLEDRLMLSASTVSGKPAGNPTSPAPPATNPTSPNAATTGTPPVTPSVSPQTTTVTWTGGAGTTNWTDAANWSTDALPAQGADVVINVATATTIQIAYANVSIDSLTTNAQISVGLAASLSAATLNASANVLLEGGTISNTTINMSPGSALVGSAYPGGTLDGVTASGLLDMSNAGIDIADGLTLNNATMLLGDTNGTTFGTLWFTNTETLGGTGTIILGNDAPPDGPTATNAFDLVDPLLTVTIGPGITIRGNSATFQGYNIGTFTNAGTFINQGTIAADASVAPGNFGYDTGYSGGSTATFATAINTSGVTNPARQQVYQSMRYGLGFGYTLSGLTPGASYTVRLDFASLWNIGAGTQAFNVNINGTQVLSNYDVYAAAGGLDKATAQQFTAVANANGQILLNFASVKYEAQINGIEVLSGNTQVETVAAGSLPGGITFGIVQDNEPPIFINDGTLDASNGETLSINGPWTNAAGGTINSSGATLSLGDPTGYYDPWSNSGTITVTGSTLNLGGLFTLPGMGTFNQSANTVNLVGMLDNTGTTLALSPATGSWVLDGGTLKNGTLTETGGAELEFTTSGTLDGVTVDGNLDLTGDSSAAQPDVDVADADVIDGLVLNGTADLGNASGTTYGRLFFNNNETLSGTGTVVFGTNVWNELSGNTSWMFPTTLTIGPGITVLGSGGTVGTSSLVNEGTIIAEVTGPGPSPDTIYVGSDVTNEGTIEAMTGETLTIYNCTNTAGSTISAYGSQAESKWRVNERTRRLNHRNGQHRHVGRSQLYLNHNLVELRLDHCHQQHTRPGRRLHARRDGSDRSVRGHRQSGRHAQQHRDHARFECDDRLLESRGGHPRERHADRDRGRGAGHHGLGRDPRRRDGRRQSRLDGNPRWPAGKHRSLRQRRRRVDAQRNGLSRRRSGLVLRRARLQRHRNPLRNGDRCFRQERPKCPKLHRSLYRRQSRVAHNRSRNYRPRQRRTD